MKCPTCEKALVLTTPRPSWFPFCCVRCQMADLGKWLDEDYKISEPAGTSDAVPSPPTSPERE